MTKYRRPIDKAPHIVVKLAMTAIFLWSGFFWSGVTVLNFYINDLSNVRLANLFLAGSAILLAALLLCWFRLYIVQMIFTVAGLAVYLIPSAEMVNRAARTGVPFKPTFEQRYLPVIGFAILALVLFIIRIWQLAAARIERRQEFDNRPTESVLEKHREE